MRSTLLAFLLCVPLLAQLTPEQKARNIESFEQVWSTIRDKHWDNSFASGNWKQVHDELLPRVQAARSMEEARGVISDMIGRVHLTHFGLIPNDLYESLDQPGKTRRLSSPFAPEGAPGFETRVIEGLVLVTHVEKGSPAEAAHIQPGWQVREIDDELLAPLVDRLSAQFHDSTLQQLMLERAIEHRLTGRISTPVRVQFLDGSRERVDLSVPRAVRRGESSQLGYLPPMNVWFESRRIGDVGYFGFNVFLDPARLMPAFEEAVRGCSGCRGFVVDLRGNPGGIGIMAMGIAGFFMARPDQRLGTMQMRDVTLNFVINPRPPVFTGPLAILIDGLSASTSEIFAGGLRDLGRARLFGTHTAGAALPSVIEKLPNGDAFQYAVANYTSEGGATLEGRGVTPDQVVPYDRTALLAGRDAALEAALAWIHSQKGPS